MSQRTETVRATAKYRTIDTPQGKVRATRLEVTQADLDMYAVIVGRTPTAEEQTQALQPPTEEEIAEIESAMDQSVPVLRSWSPLVLCSYLCGFSSMQFKVRRPQIAGWVQRVSVEARRRLQESHARLGSK